MERSLQVGLCTFATDESLDPVSLGRAAEEAGLAAVALAEHTHIPVSRATPYPAGGPLPREYARTHDPFVALAAMAASTQRLRLVTGVCLVVERDPIITAKEVASLDRISGGRVLFGVGAGWNREEMANHGTDAGTRFALLGERLDAMRAIWTQEEAAFAGDHVRFDPIWCWPKPVQVPHPPILVGGGGPGVLQRVLDHGDGWFPIRRRDGDEELAARIAQLRRMAAERGREHVPVVLYGARARPEALERYAAMGVDLALFLLPPEAPHDALQRIARYGEMARSWRGGDG